ncbi:MAG: hypothetical protein IT223_01770 [Crocinitomicaceae bacterium]|nr:hypothetical protein [Crocinitomicaceae bacterium]
MNDALKYDPEDIESLLLHKSFGELYIEEKTFVLQHLDGPEEYESMRKILRELHQNGTGEEWIEPDPALKAGLIAEFSHEERKGFLVWLNTLFAASSLPWYRKPAFHLAFGIALTLITTGIFILSRHNSSPLHFAELSQKETTSVDSTASQQKDTEKEISQPDVFPPVPMALAEKENPDVKVPGAKTVKQAIISQQEEVNPRGEDTFSKTAGNPPPMQANNQGSNSRVNSVPAVSDNAAPAKYATEESLSKAATYNAVSKSRSMTTIEKMISILYTAQ